MTNWYDLFLKCNELVQDPHISEESIPNPHTCVELVPNTHTCEELVLTPHICEESVPNPPLLKNAGAHWYPCTGYMLNTFAYSRRYQ